MWPLLKVKLQPGGQPDPGDFQLWAGTLSPLPRYVSASEQLTRIGKLQRPNPRKTACSWLLAAQPWRGLPCLQGAYRTCWETPWAGPSSQLCQHIFLGSSQTWEVGFFTSPPPGPLYPLSS